MSKGKQQPNPILEGLMERRTIFLEGDIDDNSVSDVSSRLLELQIRSTDPINLVINSGGGSFYGARQLCDQMKSLMTAPVRGIAFGECGSSATFIMLHCGTRVSTPYSRFLIHSGNLGEIDIPIGRTSSKVAEQLLADIKSTEAEVIQLYIDHLTPKEWKEGDVTDVDKITFVQDLIDRGDQRFNSWLSPDEAIEIGMIESVISGKLDIFQT